METTDFNPEIKKILDEAVESLLSHTVQILKKTNGEIKPHGTGVFVHIYDKYILFTASHVVEDSYNVDPDGYTPLLLKLRNGLYVHLVGEIKSTIITDSQNLDIAYVILDDGIINYILDYYVFLPTNKILSHTPIVGGTNYCVIGYPELNILRDNNSIITGATSYLVGASKPHVYKHYNRSPNDNIIIDMKGKGVSMFDDKPSKTLQFLNGFSGAGLWFFDIQLNMDGKFICDYKLVGIMTDYRKGKYYCMIAHKIHTYMSLLSRLEGFKFK